MTAVTPLHPDAVLTRSDGVLEAYVASGAVLYTLGDQKAHVLNDSATTVWLLADDGTRVAEVIDAVAARFPDHPAVTTDVAAALDDLVGSGLLHTGPPEAATDTPPPAHSARSAATDDGAHDGTGAAAVRAPEQAEAPAVPVGTVTVAGLEHVIEITCHHPALLETLEWLLDPLRSTAEPTIRWTARAGDAPDTYVIDPDRGAPMGPTTLANLVAMLPIQLNRLMAERTATMVVLHASAAHRHGHTVVLPADPESGKSTLVTALLARRFAYLTDEALGLRLDDAAVRPYRKRISLDPGSQDVFPHLRPALPRTFEVDGLPTGQWQVHPRDAGDPETEHLPPAARPTAIVFPRFDAAASLTLEPLEPEQALLRLLGQTFNLANVAQAGMDTLAELAATTPCFTLTHSDCAAAAERIEALLDELAHPDGTLT